MGLSIVGIAIGKDVGTEEDADQSIQEAISFQKARSSAEILFHHISKCFKTPQPMTSSCEDVFTP